MKAFVFKTACFLLGLWLFTWSLAGAANRLAPMNVYGDSQAEGFRTLMAKKDSIQAISIGNSHSEAIDFATFGLAGQNLSRKGADLFEVKLYVRSVAPQLPELERVFISISYFSFTNNNVLREDTQNLRIELYGMLPTWKPLPGDANAFILGKLNRFTHLMSITRPDNWNQVFENALENKPAEEFQPLWSVTTKTAWGECSHFTEEELAAIGYEIGYKAAANHLKFLQLDPHITAQSEQALVDTIELLQKRGVRVILFIPPYHSSYNNRFYETSPEIIEGMRQAVANIQARLNVEYYDAASLAQFSTRPELFYNSDHLNECGMRAFSEYLKNEMANP